MRPKILTAILIFSIMLTLIAGCTQQEEVKQGTDDGQGISGGREDPDCVCTAIYDPVCGVDGNTYSNSCRAQCAGVEIDSQGEC